MEDTKKDAVIPKVGGKYTDKLGRELHVTEIDESDQRGRQVRGTIFPHQDVPQRNGRGRPYSTSIQLFDHIWTTDLEEQEEVKGV